MGEVAADALRDDVVGRGVRLVPREVSVGARISWTGGAADLAEAFGGEVRRLVPCSDVIPDSSLVALRPDGLPPLPEAGRAPTGCVLLGGEDAAGGEGGGVVGRPPAGVWPDGAATGEWYVSVDLPGAIGGDGDRGLDREAASLPGLAVVRPAHVVRGEVLPSVAGFAPLPEVPGCFVAGQAAGARGYLGSLLAGVGVARLVVQAVGGEVAGP